VLVRAYASHGDTKLLLMFPEDPVRMIYHERQAFDLPTGCRTRIFVLLRSRYRKWRIV